MVFWEGLLRKRGIRDMASGGVFRGRKLRWELC